jgi:anti-sigma regulatory factor (Ser/Thr protein kinase)
VAVKDRTDVVAQRELSLRAVPDAAPQAREALGALLAGSAFQHRGDDGALAVSELVTNAVLHGREPVVLRLTLTQQCARVEVEDASPISPSFSMLDPTAVTGRGLMLISAASDRWGVEPVAEGKQVWFELLADGRAEELESDVDALLAAWGDDLAEDPAHEQVRVVLTDLDTELIARAEAHVEGLLRELCLLVGDDVPPMIRRVARSVLQAAAGMDVMRADLKHQLALAVSAGQPLVDLRLTLRRDDAELVRDYSHAVDEADRLSRAGRLLTAPAPAELSEARQSYLRRLLAQLTS